MRILVAPDKFKGSLSAHEAAVNIAAGVRDVISNAKIDIVPVADGGEGTAEIIRHALGGVAVACSAHDPLGRVIECQYGLVEDDKLAIMEMSEASGLRHLGPQERDPMRATTFGVGEMILDAIHRGAKKIIIGLGGSATNDGGFGMARALGFRFFAENGSQLRAAVGKLSELELIEKPAKLSLPEITAAVDVANPLLGKNGATRTFAAQKGATAKEMKVLEKALTRLAKVVARQFGFDKRKEPGSGAAGGLGFGLMSFAGAIIRPGFDVVARAIGLESKIKDADVIITGEGSLDLQTLNGKAPAGVARLARNFGKPVYAVVGRATHDRAVRVLFRRILAFTELVGSEKEARARAAELARQEGRELAKIIREPGFH